jgi:hypothetical protein
MSIRYPVIAESIYNGRDNRITLVLYNDESVLTDLSGLTRVTVKLDDTTTIDSDVVGATVIWWTDSITYRGTSTDVLRFKLGGQSITAGEYSSAEVVVYDSTLTNGAQLQSPLKLTVYD